MKVSFPEMPLPSPMHAICQDKRRVLQEQSSTPVSLDLSQVAADLGENPVGLMSGETILQDGFVRVKR